MERFILGEAYFLAWPILSHELPLATIVLWPVFLFVSLKYKNIKIAYLLNVFLLYAMISFYNNSAYGEVGSKDYHNKVKVLLNSLDYLESVAREYKATSTLWQYQTDVNVLDELSPEGFQFIKIIHPRLLDLIGDVWRYSGQNHVISFDEAPPDIVPLNILPFAIIAIEDEALLYGYALEESADHLRVQKTLDKVIKNNLKTLVDSKEIILCTSNGEPFAVNNNKFCVFTKFLP
jgi:hypothetical protein